MRQPLKVLKYFIVGLHLFVLCSFIFGNYLPKKKAHRIAVHSVRLKSPPPPSPSSPVKPKSQPAQANPAPEKPKQAAPKVPPKKSKEPEKAATKPKETKKAPKKTTKRGLVSDKIRKELEESIAKIDQKRDNFNEPQAPKTKKQNSSPLALSSLEYEPAVGVSSLEDIKMLLVQELKSSLHLPDFGEVTLRFSIRSDGSVAEVKVLKSASKKNSEYLERELPKHSFPSLSGYGLKGNERNFVITFCNEL